MFDGTDLGVRIKTLRPRGGGAENLVVERVRASHINYAFYCDMLGSIKWGGDLAKLLPAREITLQTPDFNTVRINNMVVEHCRQLVLALGLPERPLRNVLMSNVKADCEQLMKMRDVQGFVLKDTIMAKDPTASIDGCTATMLLNVKLNGGQPQDIIYLGEKSTPVIIE